MKSPLMVNLALLLIAFVWGFGFIPQREGMNYIGPAAFNALRFGLGALTLLPFLMWGKSGVLRQMDKPSVVMGGVLGFLLFGGAIFQQISIQYTPLANVAFITGLYVIIVPVIGYFIGYKYKAIVWLGGITAMIGLYLMTGSSTELRLKGDLLALVGAVFWAIHLLVLSRKAADFNQLILAFIQFSICALLSLIAASLFEPKVLPDVLSGYIWPLLNGVIVVGGAYTLQVFVMEYAEPFAASLILALEAVFGALAGYLIYQEQMGGAALIGAVMMLFGCILAQLPKTQLTEKPN